MAFQVERDWITAAGLRAVVIMGDRGYRCGYVGVPVGHPLHGCDYSEPAECLAFPSGEPIGKRGIIPLLCSDGEARPDVVFDVHGGLTFSGGRQDYPVAGTDLWWFGYDCAHCDDAPSPEYTEAQREKYPDKDFMWRVPYDAEHRTLEYCVAECESLARQMVERVASNA